MSSARSSVKAATLVSLAYVATASSFFAVWNLVADSRAAHAADVAYLSLWRGIAFTAVTGIALFAVVRRVVARAERDAAELAKAQDLIVRADQRVVAGTLAAGAAHDFRNLLTVVGGTAEMLDAVPGLPPNARTLVGHLLEATDRGVEIVQQLVESGRRIDPTKRSRRALATLLGKCAELTQAHESVRLCAVEVRRDADPEVEVFPAILSQAVINLILNAAEAVSGGRIVLSVSRDADEVVLAVDDDGPGIPPELESRLFDSCVTTKPAGTGLGLVSVKVCAKYHGGRVTYRRSPELGGARFEIRLPATSISSALPGAA